MWNSTQGKPAKLESPAAQGCRDVTAEISFVLPGRVGNQSPSRTVEELALGFESRTGPLQTPPYCSWGPKHILGVAPATAPATEVSSRTSGEASFGEATVHVSYNLLGSEGLRIGVWRKGTLSDISPVPSGAALGWRSRIPCLQGQQNTPGPRWV